VKPGVAQPRAERADRDPAVPAIPDPFPLRHPSSGDQASTPTGTPCPCSPYLSEEVSRG
jgi:hypothetical protein